MKLKLNPVILTFEAIGTHWQILLYEAISPSLHELLETKIHARIEAFDQTYSRFRSDSLVTVMAHTVGAYELPADAPPLIELYLKLNQVTSGAMTPLVGRLLVEAGYDADYTLKAGSLHAIPTLDEVITWQKPNLTLKQPFWLDFGAAGKGYLVDLISELIENFGITQYCVNAGGDMKYRHASTSLKVGLENPTDSTQAVGAAEVYNQSLCGSAGNRRAWSNYHHIINPYTLESPRQFTAVWVTAADTLTADGLTTALYFVEPSMLEPLFDFEYAFVMASGETVMSKQFPGYFFK